MRRRSSRSGLESEAQVIEYRAGNSAIFSTIKMPGLKKVGNVTMKKGIFVTDDDKQARAVNERLSRMLRRPLDEIEGRLPVGSPAMCLDLFGRYRDAGLGRALVWPMQDEVEQLERVAEQVMAPLVSGLDPG